MNRANSSKFGDKIPWPVWLGLALAMVTVGYPVLLLFLKSLFPLMESGSIKGAFRPYAEMVQTEGLAEMWQNSLTCAAITTGFSWVLGLPAGWLMARTDLPFKPLLRVSLLLPVMSPPYLLALAYVMIFQANGLYDGFMGPLPEWIRETFFSFWGVVFVMGLTSFGTVALLVETAMESISSRLDDAAQCLGASQWAVLRRITLPLLLPALINSGILVFVDTLSNFGIAAVLGPRSNLVLLPAVIYELLTTWPVDVPLAAAISSLLAITAMVLVAIGRFLIGAKVLASSRVPVSRTISLKLWQNASAWSFFGGLFFFSSVVPNAVVLLMSLIDRWQMGRPTFTVRHYEAIFAKGSGGAAALSTSLFLSLAAATACVAIGAIVAYALARYQGRGVAMLDHLSMLPRVLPNLVISVALILAWNAPWIPFRIYGTLTVLFLAYVAIYQAVGLRFADTAMQQISVRLEQAAACLGAGMPSILWRIVFPLLRPGLFIAWVSIFVMCLRDWVASIMLLPPGAQTVGSFIFSQFEQGDFAQAMAMAVCTVVLSSILLVFANLKFQQRHLQSV